MLDSRCYVKAATSHLLKIEAAKPNGQASTGPNAPGDLSPGMRSSHRIADRRSPRYEPPEYMVPEI